VRKAAVEVRVGLNHGERESPDGNNIEVVPHGEAVRSAASVVIKPKLPPLSTVPERPERPSI
jgi:hypothetical protein